MKKKELIITKENYKGYLELYLLKMTPFKISEEYSEVDESKCCRVINYITMDKLIRLLNHNKILTDMIENEELGMLFMSQTVDELYGKTRYARKNLVNIYTRFQMLKMKYPYLDLELNREDIEQALFTSGLLKIKENEDKKFYKIDYKSFEDYLNIRKRLKSISLFDEFHYQAVPRYNYSKVKAK